MGVACPLPISTISPIRTGSFWIKRIRVLGMIPSERSIRIGLRRRCRCYTAVATVVQAGRPGAVHVVCSVPVCCESLHRKQSIMGFLLLGTFVTMQLSSCFGMSGCLLPLLFYNGTAARNLVLGCVHTWNYVRSNPNPGQTNWLYNLLHCEASLLHPSRVLRRLHLIRCHNRRCPSSRRFFRPSLSIKPLSIANG